MRLSEIAAGVGVVCLLLALLTWLLMRGIATDAAVYSTTLRIFDDFALAEASLDRDVLQARAGLLTDYDPLVRSSEQIAAAVSQLRAQAASEGLDTAPVDRLAAATKIEEKLTERFKSDNALLRNSLSYVGHLSTSPGINDRNFRLGALATAILQLTLDSSARAQQAVEERLLEVAQQAPVEADQGTAQALISHARLLKILLPSVDDTLRGLFAVQTGPPLEETRTQFARLHISLGILGATVSPAPLCDVRSTCARAHRSRKTAQGPSGSAAKAGGVRASDRRAIRAPDQLPACRDQGAA